jgi:thioredoxin reductase (NADPH)
VIETDALVIGAGPVGLFVVFELGLLGITAQVVDVQDEPGGQCIALYPDKPIYDLPGIPRCSGRELTQRLLQQIQPFKPGFHLGQQVSALAHQSDGRWHVTTQSGASPGQEFMARVVLIAAGVGAFVPKELKVPGLPAFLGRQLFYGTAPGAACAGRQVVIVGGEEQAVASALLLSEPGPNQPQSVTLVYRRDVLQADAAQLAAFASRRASGQIKFVAGQITAIQNTAEKLEALTVSTQDAASLSLPLDTLLVCQGFSPKLGPLSDWGLAMERKQLSVDTETFATSASGVYAVGDVVHYPGKKKLLVCGFHEATLAAFAAAALIHPEASGVLQYTTSSALLQQRLGVLSAP